MTILEFFKTVHPSVLAAKMIFRHLQKHYSVFKIADIADTSSGGTPNRGIVEYYNGDIPWVKSGELKDGLIKTCGEYITEAGLKNSSAKLFPKGTLVVAMYGANIGKIGVLDFDATTNQAVCAIFPKIAISKEYLYWYFKQQRIDFIAVGKGGAQPNISQTIINNALIAVPDYKVQEKIVKFLERIENGDGIDYDFFIPEVLKDVETIYKYKKNYVTLSDSFEIQITHLDKLNQAILQEAVQGKLVKQDLQNEPASELLKRIKAGEATLRQAQANGKKAKPFPLIKPEEIPFEIPENWVWCKGDTVAKYIDPQPSHRTPPFSTDGIPYVAMSDINKNGSINFHSARKVSNIVLEEHRNRYQLQVGDFIFGKIGTIGKPVKLSEPFNYTLSANIILIQPKRQIINEDYLFYFLCSPIADKILRDKKSTTSYPVFGMGKARDMTIPLPPLSEQSRIVDELEKQFAKIKQLKERIISSQQSTEQLLKALLHQAFEVNDEKVKTVLETKGKVVELTSSTLDWDNLVAEPFEKYAAHPVNNIRDIDWEMAMMVACMKNKLGVTYGDVGLQKNVYNTNHLQPIFSKQYTFANSNFGTYCHELKEDLKRNPYLIAQKIANNKEVYTVHPKYNKQVLNKLSAPENKEFIQAINRMLSIYEHCFINKETDKIELYNTVLKVALDKNIRDIDSIYQGMKDWKINQTKHKTKAEKFSKNDVQKMLKLLIAKNVLEI